MNNVISVNELIKKVRTGNFLQECLLPMGYAEGYPIVRQCKGEGYLVIPFLRYQLTGKVDKTLVYPIRAAITVRARDGKIVGYQDLTADCRFTKVDFNKPIGLFRHESIRSWNKQMFLENKKKLFELYDSLLAAIAEGKPQSAEESEQMAQLLQTMVEPCQLPIYQALDGKFYECYLDRG